MSLEYGLIAAFLLLVVVPFFISSWSRSPPSEQGEINFPVSPLHGHRMGRHFGGHVAATISRDGGSQRGNIHNSARRRSASTRRTISAIFGAS
jgi:hypothetical protein